MIAVVGIAVCSAIVVAVPLMAVFGRMEEGDRLPGGVFWLLSLVMVVTTTVAWIGDRRRPAREGRYSFFVYIAPVMAVVGVAAGVYFVALLPDVETLDRRRALEFCATHLGSGASPERLERCVPTARECRQKVQKETSGITGYGQVMGECVGSHF
jgi:hypothetical protein